MIALEDEEERARPDELSVQDPGDERAAPGTERSLADVLVGHQWATTGRDRVGVPPRAGRIVVVVVEGTLAPGDLDIRREGRERSRRLATD